MSHINLKFVGFIKRNRQLVGSLSKIDNCGDQDIDGRIILRGLFRTWEGLWELDGAGSG
jgi:hypothetical protein